MRVCRANRPAIPLRESLGILGEWPQIRRESGPSRPRAVVDPNYFQIWIIQFGERSQSSRKFLLFVACSKEQGYSRWGSVERGTEILKPGEAKRTVGDSEGVEKPKKGDTSKKENRKNACMDWCPKQPQVILAWHALVLWQS